MEPIENLTKAEVELLKLVVEGLNEKEIARVLGCSVRTVEHNRRQILHKLGIKPGPICVIPKGAFEYREPTPP